ncbi:hypothetical protein AVEN_90911-1, partial [Araneus ventricosus]
MLAHDKTPVHRSYLVSNYLSKHPIPVLLQLAHSPDLRLTRLFPRITICLRDTDSQVPKKCSVQRRMHRMMWQKEACS